MNIGKLILLIEAWIIGARLLRDWLGSSMDKEPAIWISIVASTVGVLILHRLLPDNQVQAKWRPLDLGQQSQRQPTQQPRQSMSQPQHQQLQQQRQPQNRPTQRVHRPQQQTRQSMNYQIDEIYQRESAEIVIFLQSFEQLHGFKLESVVRTPYTIVYQITVARGVRIQALAKHMQDLSNAIRRLRRKYGIEDTGSAYLDQDNECIVVERFDPGILKWSERHGIAKAWHALLGRYYIGASSSSLEVNLDHSQEFSFLVGGTSGSGKSTLIDGMLLSAAEASSPDLLNIWIIDIGTKRFGDFKKLNHVGAFASTVPGAMQMLREAEARMTGPEGQYNQRTLIALDEIQRLTMNEDKALAQEAVRLLSMIATMGRGYGIGILIATQHPLASVVPTIIRNNCVVRIAGRCLNGTQSEVILGDKEYGAASISSTGQFLFIAGPRRKLFYSYYIDDVKTEIEQINSSTTRCSWIDFDGEVTKRNEEMMDEIRSSIKVQAAVEEPIPDAVLGVFQQYTSNGKLRKGFQTNAINVYAEYLGKSSAGTNYDKYKGKILSFAETYRRLLDETDDE